MNLAIDKDRICVHQTDGLYTVKPPIIDQKTNVIPFAAAIKKLNLEVKNSNIIGDFKQGFMNNCWFCAEAKSLSLTPAGRVQLNRMISKNDDGSYTVIFASGKKFQVTEAELNDKKVKLPNGEYARFGSDVVEILNKFPYIRVVNPYVTYSTGDKTLKLLEIAANKYVHSLVTENVKLGKIDKKYENSFCLNNYILDEKLLWGDLSYYPTSVIDLNKINVADIMQVASNSGKKYNQLMWKGYEHHSYSVKRIDKVNKLIYLINPHDTKQEPLCLSFEEFYKHFCLVLLKGNYKNTYKKTTIPQNHNLSELAKGYIKLAERQTMDSRLAQEYITCVCNIYDEMGNPEMKAKIIAKIIEYSSKGLGTHDETFIGAVLSINSKATLASVNKYLSSQENAEYKTNTNNALETYINEEFSFSTKTKLLEHIQQLR